MKYERKGRARDRRSHSPLSFVPLGRFTTRSFSSQAVVSRERGVVTRSVMRRRCVLAIALWSAACGSSSPDPGGAKPSPPPDPFQGALKLATITDTNPDPSIVEVNLVAEAGEWELAPGQTVHAMTYNGSVPGPLLEAHVGDTLRVHFENRLAEPTTVHWHGVRVAASMDGSPMAQTPVKPGGKFDYELKLLDAGTFWYHSHVDEGVQMEHGLYGAIVVRAADEPHFDAEGVVMLDDLTLGPDGQIAPPGGPIEEHTGREGPISLLNGKSGVEVPIRAGERQRWRIVNAGSARTYRFAIPNHTFTVLGSDGGPVPAPYETGELFLVPGDRMDVLVTGVGKPQDSEPIQNLPYKRGHGGGVFTTMELGRLVYDDGTMSPSAVPALSRAIAAIDTTKAIPRSVVLDEIVDPKTGDTTFTIDGEAYPNIHEFSLKVGETQVWDLQNKSGMDHPFHLHGFFFQVVEQGKPPASWEDTLNLKAKTTTRVAFIPDDRPGDWMFHCHVLEHAAHGMMGAFRLDP